MRNKLIARVSVVFSVRASCKHTGVALKRCQIGRLSLLWLLMMLSDEKWQ